MYVCHFFDHGGGVDHGGGLFYTLLKMLHKVLSCEKRVNNTNASNCKVHGYIKKPSLYGLCHLDYLVLL